MKKQEIQAIYRAACTLRLHGYTLDAYRLEVIVKREIDSLPEGEARGWLGLDQI